MSDKNSARKKVFLCLTLVSVAFVGSSISAIAATVNANQKQNPIIENTTIGWGWQRCAPGQGGCWR